ncbi:hypothetical protein N7519_006679 [Penicillium mononematosum]|uniref:uncharacterized protein n=1 Tax=Penicillium mononematosum TaxID=268346 RepID=UPI0025481972|nr:uncharacterized protein N7519_006679 [Penicillium mononematosum]KAJ6185378.1 hypothetical protein N7519_006679 [Penicillium mononematosum]
MGTTTTALTRSKRKGHVVEEKPTRVMPARKAKSQSKSPVEFNPQKGRKRRKVSEETKAKKRQAAQGQPGEVQAEYVPSANDLISDVPRDENFTIDTLLPDLATSYVGRFKSPAAPARAKRKPWPRQSSPLIDPEKLPPGWSMTEPDLDRDDIDAQIERCHVRIKENIMPHIFEHRLKGLKISQAKRNALVASEPGNHSLAVLKRLEVLRNIEVELQSSDNFNQLPNVRALLQAYREGRLHWNIGLVTYWFEGVQLCEPRPFSWDEFEVLNAHHSGKTGFWMEGYEIAIRVPGTRWYAELEFVYDTGASMMTLYEGDIQNIMGTSNVEPPIMGLNTSVIADGSTMTSPVVEVEVTILDTERRRLTRWVRIQCEVSRGWCGTGDYRLDGPLRQLLYTASAPRNNDKMYIASNHPDIIRVIPDTGSSRSGPAHNIGKMPLGPGGGTSVLPSGAPGDDAEPAPVLHLKMPRRAP